MSGFNLAELLPFYLDETDENIAALNDSLLRLEQDPTDVKALQEAFRMFHSIKGASVVMGFHPVNQLTHHLESLFEELRSKKRSSIGPILDLTFRCLDELRDYHRDLRAQGNSTVDLSAPGHPGDCLSALDWPKWEEHRCECRSSFSSTSNQPSYLYQAL